MNKTPYLLLGYLAALAFVPLLIGSFADDFARKVVPDRCVENTTAFVNCNFGGN